MLLHDAFDFQAQARGDTAFARFDGREITYAEAARRSRRMACALLDLGLRPGDRFCVLMRNSVDTLLLMYAASRAGLVLTPLNYRLAPPEWADLILDAEAAAVIADPDFCAGIDAALSAPAARRLARISAGEARGELWSALDALLAVAPADAPDVTPDPEDIVFQMYTSGTTGRSKGALLNHRSVNAHIVHSTFAAPHRFDPGERTLVVLPLFHIAAIATALGAAAYGATLVIHREVDPLRIANALAEDEIVVASFVPAVIQLLLNAPGVADMRFPHLRYVGYGASPIAEAVLRRALEVFDCAFAQGYGMTELAGSCCMLTEADHRRALQGRPELLLSAGRALPGVEVRVVGPDGQRLAPGETGEIIVRGPQVMSGYWRMPEATAEALRGGWMHTGDAGYMDAEGYLFIRDRIKDMIVSGAENVYPAEVEGVLYAHPGVAEAAVIGVPDERWGETVMAVVVRRAGEVPSEAELDSFCRGRLGGFKVPRRYKFVEALPRNPSGKVLKRELRKEFWSQTERQVG